ncbi:hypothetical protein [Vibrio owensii]|uniref:hypothetical protein n=1 Tax=Vibrio owensii TaxID=696485 RepID=UPI003CC54B7F
MSKQNTEILKAQIEAVRRKVVIRTEQHYATATLREWMQGCLHAINNNGELKLPPSAENTIEIPRCLRGGRNTEMLIDARKMTVSDFTQEYRSLLAILPRKSLQDRFWAFSSAEYEAAIGMTDLIATFNKYEDAYEFMITDGEMEWGCIFDKETGIQADLSDQKKYGNTSLSNPMNK